MTRIRERLNAIAEALETASKQTRLLAADLECTPEQIVQEINRRTELFFQTATHDNPEESEP